MATVLASGQIGPGFVGPQVLLNADNYILYCIYLNPFFMTAVGAGGTATISLTTSSGAMPEIVRRNIPAPAAGFNFLTLPALVLTYPNGLVIPRATSISIAVVYNSASDMRSDYAIYGSTLN